MNVNYDPRDAASTAYFPYGFAIRRDACQSLHPEKLLPEKGPLTSKTARQALRALTYQAQSIGLIPNTIRYGELLAFSLLEEILRYLTHRYNTTQCPGAIEDTLKTASRQSGGDLDQRVANTFQQWYPSGQTLRQQAGLPLDPIQSPQPATLGCEMILLYLAMENPAAAKLRPLFDDSPLRSEVPFALLIGHLETGLASRPPLQGIGLTLFEALRAPAKAHPESLEAQLDFIRRAWGPMLPAELFAGIVFVSDILQEEIRERGLGPGPAQVLQFGAPPAEISYFYPEPERFTPDRAWMANVVIIAKNIYVWLDQLSKHYGRTISRMDEIPDDELDRLAVWGFTGLWLIGVWERSNASRRIKQMTGNPEAAASAYALYDYTIAEELGGEAAFQRLRERARQRGIRLAADMVPNHVGLFSKWIVEHPEWFIQLEEPPYPVYRFTGPDLSEDPRICLQIEDGYWDRRDAAVVFKRLDRATGQTRYIYHGNDGTSMPWNDTAQLDFRNPDVREAVTQTIIAVARRFPVIRFDAAMTLTKRHYQRLWFPQPGDAGAIPSRVEHSMSRADFEKAIPEEFWRQVVDRINAEVPDTLLLAEAFWLMEGFFVRTLGMHRVYNSAFMNMLKMEENANYRQTIKNVLEFSPAVLQRFVNFMNNPDERTAVEQFGKGDKYYGIAVMMVTMPGLPMFGHGQIEGFTEKYGMEYRKAYWDEPIDEHMVYRHETEVFPLMRRRATFSGADSFALYDFVVPEGWVDENVFAYSNHAGGDRALIVYNNAFTSTAGRIKTSTAINTGAAGEKNLIRRNLAEALGLQTGANVFHIFRDHRTQLEYIRQANQFAHDGLHVELNAYQYHAFIGFRSVEDNDGSWARLEASLTGRGIPNIEEARQELAFANIIEPFRVLMSAATLRRLAQPVSLGPGNSFEKAMTAFWAAAVPAEAPRLGEQALTSLGAMLEAFWSLAATLDTFPLDEDAIHALRALMPMDEDPALPYTRIMLAHVMLAEVLDRLIDPLSPERIKGSGVPVRLLLKPVPTAFKALGADDWQAERDFALVRLLCDYPALLSTNRNVLRAGLIKDLMRNPAGVRFLQIHDHQGVMWFHKESLEELLNWRLKVDLIHLATENRLKPAAVRLRVRNRKSILKAADMSGFQVNTFQESLKK